MNQKRRSFMVDKLKVEIFPDRKAMGEAAGHAVVERMKELLKEKENLFMVFAAAPSQNEFLDTLAAPRGSTGRR